MSIVTKVTLFGAAFALLTAGCGRSGPETGTVSGRVTLDGKDVPTGAIRFIPTDGQSPTAGAIITDGAYSAQVPVGEMRVEITAPRPVPGKGPPKPNAAEEVEESVPARFNANSELRLTVAGGVNAKDFALSGK